MLADRWRLHLDRLKAEGRYRALMPPTGIDFSSNDYLGYSNRSLARSPGDLKPLSRSGAASRLLRGQHPIWEEIESRLAAWHHAEAALMMTSGYSANEGLLSSVIEPTDCVFSDQLNHASIIDGLRLIKAERVIFPHNDVHKLESLLSDRVAIRPRHQAWYIVTESLFGMEGDRAPLRELAELSERFHAHLIIDEAHATGCFGADGNGLVDDLGVRDRVLATVHTGGKALAVSGGYIVGSRLLKEFLVNRCRHFIFTTALPPQIGNWWLDALSLVSTDDASRARLHSNTKLLRIEAARHGMTLGGSDYIVSLTLGTDNAAVAAAQRLQSAGFDVRAIRPPTVPEGTARLRISIHADHDTSVLSDLVNAMAALQV